MSSLPSNTRPPKFEIGYVFCRPGLCALRICGHTHDGRYLAHPVLRVIPTKTLSRLFPKELLRPGAVLRVPNGANLLLVETVSGSTWNVTHYGELIELTDSDIENFQAESKAADDYPHVATCRNRPDKKRCRVRYLPRKIAGKPQP